MCFYTRQTHTLDAVEKRFQAKMQPSKAIPMYEVANAFSFPRTPVITNQSSTSIQLAQWGLIPHWAQDIHIQAYTLNAKIETLHEKPSFQKILSNRCLVIADGFYEWQWKEASGKRKQKYLITLPNQALFAFAGLWDTWVDKKNHTMIHSYTIVTTDANDLMKEIHNSKKRMPVILPPDLEKDWLEDAPISDFVAISPSLTAKPLAPTLLVPPNTFSLFPPNSADA